MSRCSRWSCGCRSLFKAGLSGFSNRYHPASSGGSEMHLKERARTTGGKRRRPPRQNRWGWAVLGILGVSVLAYVFVGRSREPVPAATLPTQVPRLPPLPSSRGRMSPPPDPGRTFPVVELNTASIAELQTLPGITREYAQRIIAGRPYRLMQDLERTGIPRSVLDQISPPALIRSTQTGPPPPGLPTPPGSPPLTVPRDQVR